MKEKKRFFASCYIDKDKPVDSNELTRIVDSITDSNIPALIKMDSNSHSTIWNCKDTDSRGHSLETLIFQYNMEILNKGSEPTFVSSRYSTIIDLSLVIGSSKDVTSWMVNNIYQFSGHRLIEITLSLECSFNDVMKIRKTDWTLL